MVRPRPLSLVSFDLLATHINSCCLRYSFFLDCILKFVQRFTGTYSVCKCYHTIITLFDTFVFIIWKYLYWSGIRHMKTSSNGNIFRVTGPLWGKPPVTGGFSSQRSVTRSFNVSLICVGTNDWANNRDAGDLRRHRGHYVVTAMHSLQKCRVCGNVFNLSDKPMCVINRPCDSGMGS